MPGWENTRNYGVGQRTGSLGKLEEIWRTCEGICEKQNLLKPQGLGGITGCVYGNPIETLGIGRDH